MFIPNNQGVWKFQNKSINNTPSKGLHLVHGSFGLNVYENCLLTSRQLEMVHHLLSRGTSNIGQYWIRVFPHTPVTENPLEVRMGNGNGYVEHYVCNVNRGVVLCELIGVSLSQATSLLKSIALNLPVRTLFIYNI